MRRIAAQHRNARSPHVDWRAAENALLRINAADSFADGVSEDIFDVEDEREQVDLIVHGLMHGLN